MPKKNIHPESKGVSYVMMDGTSVQIPSCYSKAEKFVLESDIFNHVAWRDDKQYVNESVGNVAKFKEKFKFSTNAFADLTAKKDN